MSEDGWVDAQDREEVVEVHVTMPGGTILAIDARVIADDRACFFSNNVGLSHGGEFDEAMATDDDLADWAGHMSLRSLLAFSRVVNPTEDEQLKWDTWPKKVVRSYK
jgi:hypothetical protein